MQQSPTIRLYDLIGCALILQASEGIVYTNQTGGYSCLQPKVKGILIPLRNNFVIKPAQQFGLEPDLHAYFTGPKHRGAGAVRGLDTEDAAEIDKILARHRLDGIIIVDRARLSESHEAWVHVSVLRDDYAPSPIFAGFGPYPRKGILTWPNSD